MSSRAVTLGLAAAMVAGFCAITSVAPLGASPAAACCTGGAGGDGDDSGGSPVVSSWVLGATNGGVSPPAGTTSCTGWTKANAGSFEGPDTYDPTEQSVAEIDGETWSFWQRTCDGVRQAVWAPAYSPEDLARIALAEVEKNLPKPTPSTSPANDVGGFVTLETWLQIGEEIDVSAMAGPLPDGLTATTTATPSAIEWYPIKGGEKITCELWGSLPTDAQVESEVEAPCGWLPPGPSAPQYGAGDDLRFNGEVVLVWSVAWTATDGSGDDLGELRSSTDWSYRVREIQTIGEDR
ncbi:MAG: hypothetical protein AB8G14_13285 [Ilumatobacter sp.]